jgi:hypothetical protein
MGPEKATQTHPTGALSSFYFGEAQALGDPSAPAEVPAGVATKDQLFEAISRVLKFPDYFGGNWDAFEECLRDLSWLPPGVVFLKHTDLPLTGDTPSLKVYLSILQGATDKWAAESERSLVVGFPVQCREQIEWVLRLPPLETGER